MWINNEQIQYKQENLLKARKKHNHNIRKKINTRKEGKELKPSMLVQPKKRSFVQEIMR